MYSIPSSAVPQFSLPTPCTDEDAHMLLHMKYQKSTVLKLFKGTVVTKQFLQACIDVFGALIQEKADKVYPVVERPILGRNSIVPFSGCSDPFQDSC